PERAEAGEDRDRGRRAAGRVDDGLRWPGQPDGGAAGPAEAGVAARRGDAERGLVGGGVEPEHPGDREPRLAGVSAARQVAPRAGGPGASQRPSHCAVSESTRAVSWSPPSCPPANHTMSTGVPLRWIAW